MCQGFFCCCCIFKQCVSFEIKLSSIWYDVDLFSLADTLTDSNFSHSNCTTESVAGARQQTTRFITYLIYFLLLLLLLLPV